MTNNHKFLELNFGLNKNRRGQLQSKDLEDIQKVYKNEDQLNENFGQVNARSQEKFQKQVVNIDKIYKNLNNCKRP